MKRIILCEISYIGTPKIIQPSVQGTIFPANSSSKYARSGNIQTSPGQLARRHLSCVKILFVLFIVYVEERQLGRA